MTDSQELESGPQGIWKETTKSEPAKHANDESVEQKSSRRHRKDKPVSVQASVDRGDQESWSSIGANEAFDMAKLRKYEIEKLKYVPHYLE